MVRVRVPGGVPLRFPMLFCCNCGASEGVDSIEMLLEATRLYGFMPGFKGMYGTPSRLGRGNP